MRPSAAIVSARPGMTHGQQPVVRDAVDGHQATAVDRAGRDREADPGDDVRVESGITVGGALGDGDLLSADGVAGAGRRQRVGDDVQDGAGSAVPGPGQLRDVQAVWLEHVGLGLEPAPQPGRPPAARAVKRANRGGEPALPVGQPGGEPGPGTAAFRQAGHGGARDLRLVHGQAERGQPGRAAFQRGQRRAPVPGAPQRRRPAVRAREPDPAAHRGRQRPPGQRQRPDRIIRHVPQCHGHGEHYGARRRLYSHAGRY